MPVRLSLLSRILLAVIAAIGVSSVVHLDLDLRSAAGTVVFYGLSGLFFAAGVLFPHIRQDRLFQLRAAAAVLMSIAGFRIAVWTALDSPISGLSTLVDNRLFVAASIVSAGMVGTFIVMSALAAVAPLRISRTYVCLGLLAGAAGGLVNWLTVPSRSALLITLGIAAWHVLVCVAIFAGRRQQAESYHAIP